MTNIPISVLRKRILARKGVVVQPKTKRLLPEEDVSDELPKTAMMKYIETKYHIKLKDVIFHGSLSDICTMLNWEVDRSTISRWRKHIRIYTGRRRNDGS